MEDRCTAWTVTGRGEALPVHLFLHILLVLGLERNMSPDGNSTRPALAYYDEIAQFCSPSYKDKHCVRELRH